MGVWQGQFNTLRLPELFNLRADPFERGDESILYDKWVIDHAFVQVLMQALAPHWLSSFKDFPVRQKSASFNLDQIMATMEAASKGAH
jgi:arylsulfatase